MAGMTDEEFYNFLNTPQTVPELPDWMRTDNPVGAAIAAADEPAPVNDSPVPDEVLAPQQPAWTPEPAPAPLSLTDPASFQGLTPPPPPSGVQSYAVTRSRTGPMVDPRQPPVDHSGAPVMPDPVALGEMATQGHDMQAAGLMTQADAAAQQADIRAEGMEEISDLTWRQSIDRQAEAHSQARARAEAMEEANRAAAAIKEIRSPWQDASTATKASGIVAAAIGGWLSVSTRSGKNGPLDAILQIVDQDFRMQQANQENQRALMYRADRQVDRLAAEHERIMRDSDLARAARIESIQQGIAAEAAKFESQITRGKYAEMYGLLENKKGEMFASFIEKDATRRRAAFENDRQARLTERGQNISAAASMRAHELEKYQAGLPSKYGQKPAEGADANLFAYSTFGDKAPLVRDPRIKVSPADEEKLRVRFENQGEIIRLAQEYKDLRTRLGRTYGGWGKAIRGMNPEERNVVAAKFAEINGTIRHMLTGAAANELEIKEVATKIGALDDWMNISNDKVVDSFIDEWKQKRQSVVDTYNITDARTGQKVDVFKETHHDPVVDVAKSPNTLAAAQDAVTSIYTGSPRDVLENMSALADYANSDSTLSAMTRNILAGTKQTASGAVPGFEATAASRVTAINNVETAAARAMAEATMAGDSRLAKEIEAKRDSLVQALKDPRNPNTTAEKRRDKAMEGVAPTGGMGTR